MHRIFILISVLLIGCSLKRQPILVGNWKPVKVSYWNMIDKTTKIIYDRNKVDSFKIEAIKRNIKDAKDNPDSDIIKVDTIGFKTKLESIYVSFDSAKLVLNNDSTFYLGSYGLVTPQVIPGWHFGDKLKGKWERDKKGNFKLMIGKPTIFFTFFYKIIKLEGNKLILGQVGEGEAPSGEDSVQPYLIIEFIKE